jgi:hypothetical protein
MPIAFVLCELYVLGLLLVSALGRLYLWVDISIILSILLAKILLKVPKTKPYLSRVLVNQVKRIPRKLYASTRSSLDRKGAAVTYTIVSFPKQLERLISATYE